jgi:hypothetical protein
LIFLAAYRLIPIVSGVRRPYFLDGKRGVEQGSWFWLETFR